MLFTLFFICLAFFWSQWVWSFHVRLMLSSLNACLIISRISNTLFLWFAQNLRLFLCQINREIAFGHIHDSK
jgi:hypothetical protein